jgi:hypothetical protein
VLFLYIVSCSPEVCPSVEYITQEVSPFSLEDVNESSSTFGTTVATTDFPEKVSAWYFGHST